MSLFEGRELLCVRGERPVFAGLSFALDRGGLLLLTGRNGSGKSSLLRLMAGLIGPRSGTLDWDGEPVAGRLDAHHRRLHYLGHRDAVKPALTVLENLSFWSRLNTGGSDELTVRRALADFRLDALAEIPARMLSEGQRRRLALARLQASSATLWLLDEPTTALDRDSTAAFFSALAQHVASGGMAAVATHAEDGFPQGARLDLDSFAVAAKDYWDRVA